MTDSTIQPITLIIRHRKENLKKCSLHGLEGRDDLIFCTYPFQTLPPLDKPILLAMEGEVLSEKDKDRNLILLDSTWRYLPKMEKALINSLGNVERRVLPYSFRTAYPRTQDDCTDPERGLASVEALFIAYKILGRNSSGLLDHYYWKEQFLKLNFS